MDEYKKEMYAKDLSHQYPGSSTCFSITSQPGNQATNAVPLQHPAVRKKMHTHQAIDVSKKDALYKKRTPNSKKRKPEVRLKRTFNYN